VVEPAPSERRLELVGAVVNIHRRRSERRAIGSCERCGDCVCSGCPCSGGRCGGCTCSRCTCPCRGCPYSGCPCSCGDLQPISCALVTRCAVHVLLLPIACTWRCAGGVRREAGRGNLNSLRGAERYQSMAGQELIEDLPVVPRRIWKQSALRRGGSSSHAAGRGPTVQRALPVSAGPDKLHRLLRLPAISLGALRARAELHARLLSESA
jgi:hypothetical protein